MDIGEPFLLFVTFKPRGVKFNFQFSGEDLEEPYVIPVPYIEPMKAILSGSVTVNYFGFTKTGIKHKL